MQKIMRFRDALKEGLIQEGHYFQTVATQRNLVTVSEDETGFLFCDNQDFITEQGETKLWRLDEVGETAADCRMVGPPTKEKLTLAGKTGYKKAMVTLDKIAAGTNILPEFFRKVYSCRLPKRKYEVKSEDFRSFSKKLELENKLRKKENELLYYFLASYCVITIREGTSWEKTGFALFYVESGYLENYELYYSDGSDYELSCAVRPEAIPRANLCLKMKDCDGSKERPWICVPAN